MSLLDKLLSNYIVSAIGAPILIVVLAIMITQDWRAFRRKDPIKIWYLREPIYPGDMMYSWAFVQRFGAYIGCAGAIVLAVAVLAIVAVSAWLQP
jgi:hypothetical protein